MPQLKHRRPTAPSISLCMIVKNEERFIEDCLDSAKDAVDEMIVVDTGSTDATVKLARGMGARVFDFEWCDDFSAARNASIQHASGDWVFWLDADERLAPGGAGALRSAVAADGFDCGLLPKYDATQLNVRPEDVLAGRARANSPVLAPRLLRRTDDLHFDGIVHENVAQWITADRRMRFVEAPVVHLGFAREMMRDRDKHARNLRLLERQVEMEPEDPTVYGYLAAAYLEDGQADNAWQAAEMGWRLAKSSPESGLSLQLSILRAELQQKNGDHDGALCTLRYAEKRLGSHPDLRLCAGQVLTELALQAADPVRRRERLESAREAYRAALDRSDKLFAQRYSLRFWPVLAHSGLGAVAYLRDRPKEALQHWKQALDIEPSSPDLILGSAEALVRLGKGAEALASIEPILDARPDGWLIAALAAESLGHESDCRALLQRATGFARERSYLQAYRLADQEALAARLAASDATSRVAPRRELAFA